MTPRGLLIDLDDTLYDYAPADAAARDALLARMAKELGFASEELRGQLDTARTRVKSRIGERGSSHSRLLYLVELVHHLGRPADLARVRSWEREFWRTFIETARLRPHARELLAGFRARGGKVAIVSDLVLEVQLYKLEAWGLYELVDALVVSEEVPSDKPAADGLLLAIERLGVPRESCVVVGDSPERDGGAARSLGLPYLRVRSSEGTEGMTLLEIAAELGLA